MDNPQLRSVWQRLAEVEEVVATVAPGSDGGPTQPHTHPVGDIEGLAEALATKADGPFPDLSGFVTGTDPRLTNARTPVAHAHAQADVTGLAASLAAKAAAVHAHPIAEITGLTAALGDKATAVHTHVIADIAGLQAALDNQIGGLSLLDLTLHNADTTNVHGITDTSALLTTSTAPELIRDTIGTALVAGSNVTITPNDGSDTITIAASAGGSGIVPAPATTLDVSAGLIVHLAADNIDGVAAGGAVDTWRDISGRSNHMTCAIGGSIRPTLQTNVVNSKPVVRFDTSDDYLQAGAFQPIAQYPFRPVTWIVVLKPPDFTVQRSIYGDGSSSGSPHLYITTSGIVKFDSASTAAFATATTTLTANAWVILEVTLNEVGAWAITTNGAANGSGTATVANFATTQAGHKLGRLSGLDIAEFLLYDRVLSSTDRTSIRTLLATKYNITVV